jgi:hypothetical protein
MPTNQRLYDESADGSALTCSLAVFHPEDNELPYFSWSDWDDLQLPGIARPGTRPPYMRTPWRKSAWGNTEHAEAMRTLSYYIDEECLEFDRKLAAGLNPCGSAPPSNDDEKVEQEIRRNIFAERSNFGIKGGVHTRSFRRRFPGRTLVGQVGCADTTMNNWHVAFVRDGAKNKFLYLEDEPIRDRTYPCLVRWTQGSGQPVMTFEDNVVFNPDPVPRSPRISVDGREGRDRSTDIDFAVSAKPLVNGEGQVIPFNRVTHFFRDLRHLFNLPKLTPPAPREVVMFGEGVTKKDLWLGEKQLLDDLNLQRAACWGPVLLDRLYGGLSVTRDYLLEVLKRAHYDEASGSVDWSPGQFRIDPNGSGFEIYLKPAKYPWNILALGRYRADAVKRAGQRVILSFVFAGRSGQSHFTLQQAVEKLKVQADANAIDLKGAVLLDEGGDVFQKLDYSGDGTLTATPLDPLPKDGIFACQRRLVRCCFFFAKGGGNASAGL